MGVAYEQWEEWAKTGGPLAFWAWCEACERLELLEARKDETPELIELRKTLGAAPAAMEER